MMTSAWEEAMAALMPLHDQVEQLREHPTWAPLVDELRACLVAIARAPGPHRELHPTLARATQLAITLVAAEVSSREHLEALRPAFNASVGLSGDSVAQLSSQADDGGSYRASAGRPRVHALPASCAPEPTCESPVAQPEVTGVVIDTSKTGALTMDEFGAQIVERCPDDLSLIARHRWERYLTESKNEEQLMLRLGDAFSVVGEAAPRWLCAWWQRQPEEDPYRAFAVTYALSVCAGVEPLERLRSCLEELAPTDTSSARCVADALQLVARRERPLLTLRWCAASHPVVRAAALELGTRRVDGPAWLSAEEVGPHLADPNPPVVIAALRGLARHGSLPDSLTPQVHQLMLGPLGQDVAIEAARCFALCGRAAPLLALRRDERAVSAWGERALEVLVWFGEAEDRGLLERLLKRAPQSPYTLDAVARFGMIETYAYLLHALDQDALGEYAAGALATLLGPLPEAEDPLSVVSWRAQLERLKPAPGARYRWGQPWQLRVVASEISAGHLSRLEVEGRLDELAVRLGGVRQPDLATFADELDGQLSELTSGLGNLSSRFNVGTYACATRDRQPGGPG